MNSRKGALLLISLLFAGLFLNGCEIIVINAPQPNPPPPPPPPPPNPVVRHANLKVEQFSAQVRPDGTVSVKGVVANSGLGPARLKTILRVDRVPESGDAVSLFDTNIDALTPGQSAPFSGEIKPSQLDPSPKVVIRATADQTNLLDESAVVNGKKVSNKDDNSEETSFQYGVNLKVLNVTRTDSNDPHVLKATADVRNLGNVTSPSFDIVWRLQVQNPDITTAGTTSSTTSSSGNITNGGTTSSTTGTSSSISTASTGPAGPSQWYVLSRQTISKLEPNKAVPSLTYVLGQTSGSSLSPPHDLSGKNVLLGVIVDPDNKVAESSEGDNTAGVQYHFPSGMPDIDVFALLAALDPPSNRIRFFPILANFGDQATGTFKGQWSRMPNSQLGNTDSTTITGTPYNPAQDNLSIPPLQLADLNKTPEFAFDVAPSDANQIVWLRYQADSTEIVSERSDVLDSSGHYRNGSNNFGDFIFYVPDRFVANLAVTGLSTAINDNGRMLTATGRIANLGNLESGPFNYQWIINGSAQKAIKHANLAASGVPITVSRSFDVLEDWRKAGTVSVALKVIPGKEDRTSNDDLLKINRVIPKYLPGTDLAVTKVDLTVGNSGKDPNFRGLDQAVVTSTVENQGRDSAGAYTFNCAIIDGGPGTTGKGDALASKKSRVHTNTFNIKDLDTRPNGRTIYGKFTITEKDPTVFVSKDSMTSAPKFLALGSTGKDDWPDLNVTSLSRQANPSKGVVRFYAAIKNSGTVTAPGALVQWYVNNTKVGKDRYLPTLKPNTSADNADACYLDYTPTAADGGYLLVEVAVDLHPETILDKNLDNNYKIINTTVNAPLDNGVASSGTKGAVLQTGN